MAHSASLKNQDAQIRARLKSKNSDQRDLATKLLMQAGANLPDGIVDQALNDPNGPQACTQGFLLLCLGAGSVAAMPITGILATKFGSKPIILAAMVYRSFFHFWCLWIVHALSGQHL
jgi:MFS family permease